MIEFQIEARINDGLGEAPPMKIELPDTPEGVAWLGEHVVDEFHNDDGRLLPVGAEIVVRRIA